MSRSVVTAISDRWESALVTAVERGTDARIARRCPDLADLLAVAGSGLADVALVSADLRSLDRTALDHLRECAVNMVGVYPPGDETAQMHLLQLGIATTIPADASAELIQEALDGLDAPTATAGSGPGWLPQGLGAAHADGLTGPSSAAYGGLLLGGTSQGGKEADPDGDVPGVIIAVWGPAGAPGRTTIALNLASELAQLGKPTVLVDADTYGGCIAQALSLLDEAPGLAAATRSADQGSLDLAALARLAPEVSPGLRVLTGTC